MIPAYKKKKDTPMLSIGQLEKLHDLFVQKGWPIEESFELSEYERYYRTLLSLNEQEQNFFLKLSEGFLHIPVSRYLDYMIAPLEQLRKTAGGDNLLFMTCTPKEDAGSVKSSSMVLYQLKGTSIRQRINLTPYHVVENSSTFQFDKVRVDNSTFVLVDDFIGTGETATGAIGYLKELCPALDSNEKICVFSIVALEKGVQELSSIGVRVFCAVTEQRGISDMWPSASRTEALGMMDCIEANLKKLKADYKRGYKQSEALVCMERCPNNTFPIYWLTKTVAPYER